MCKRERERGLHTVCCDDGGADTRVPGAVLILVDVLIHVDVVRVVIIEERKHCR